MYSALPRVQPVKARAALLDVVLGVVADAHREELQQLSAVVLVDGALVVLVVVQPDDHRRIPRQLDEDVPEVAQPVAPEGVDLVEQRARLVQLRIPGGEEAVPEERNLLLQRTPRADHPVEPVCGRPVQVPHLALVRVVAPDDVVRHILRVARMEELFDRRLVPLGRVLLQLVPGGAEPCPAQQVSHQRDVSISHADLLPHLYRKSNCSNLPLTIGAASNSRPRSSIVV